MLLTQEKLFGIKIQLCCFYVIKLLQIISIDKGMFIYLFTFFLIIRIKYEMLVQFSSE